MYILLTVFSSIRFRGSADRPFSRSANAPSGTSLLGAAPPLALLQLQWQPHPPGGGIGDPFRWPGGGMVIRSDGEDTGVVGAVVAIEIGKHVRTGPCRAATLINP